MDTIKFDSPPKPYQANAVMGSAYYLQMHSRFGKLIAWSKLNPQLIAQLNSKCPAIRNVNRMDILQAIQISKSVGCIN